MPAAETVVVFTYFNPLYEVEVRPAGEEYKLAFVARLVIELSDKNY